MTFARVLSTVFGLLMAGSAVGGAHGLAVVAGALAMTAVGAGIAFRPAATLAVLLSAATVVVSNPSPVFVALSGLCAAAYLVSRHAVGTRDPALMSWPTLAGALGFTVAGLVATSFPLQLPWLPLAAPLAALAIYVLAARPFMSGGRP